MHTRVGRSAVVLLVLAAMTGCSHTAIRGEGCEQEQVIRGAVGITGEDHELTILSGSEVTKLSIIGEDNRVVVEQGATIHKIEIIGEDNEVTCPEGASVHYSSIGEDNRLRYRN